jgi:hypothetical protein
MKYRTRTQYTEADKAMMWERWRRGESLNAIARSLDRNHSAYCGILSRTGGIRPLPAASAPSWHWPWRNARDFARRDGRSVGWGDCAHARTSAVHGEPRDSAVTAVDGRTDASEADEAALAPSGSGRSAVNWLATRRWRTS